MTPTRTIEIDFEVHKLIEAERKGFDDPPLAALRRLLGLKSPTVEPATQGRPWIGDGVTLAHGTPVKMTYNRRAYEGQIADGQWMVEGKTYTTPSGAMSVARTKKGRQTPLNGWDYWSAKISWGWLPINVLRDDAKAF